MEETDAPVGVTLQKPQPIAPPSGDDALLYGPTDRPNEPIHKNSAPHLIPPEMFAAIPSIIKAASMPGASPAAKAMLRLVDHHINSQGS